MKHLYLAASIAAAALVACGGGGGSSPVVTPGTPVPTTTPATVSYAIRWTGATHSSALSRGRSVLDVNSVEPVELAVDKGNTSLIQASGATNGTVQVVATVNGSPVPVPAPVSVSVADVTIASETAAPAPTGSPSPAPRDVAFVKSLSTVGATSFTVTMPDGSHPSTAINVSQAFSIACPWPTYSDTHDYLKIANGLLVAAGGAGDADVYLTGPKCTDTTGAALTLHFPYGFQRIAAGVAFGSITSALPFASEGTSVTVSDVHAHQLTTNGILVFGTTGGNYVKVRLAETDCQFFGSPTNCDAGGILTGPAEYGPGGFFAR